MATTISLDKNAFCGKMDHLLNVSSGSTKISDLLKNLKSWDSLTILEFIVMADNDYGSDMQPNDIAACQTVDDLADLTFSNSKLRL